MVLPYKIPTSQYGPDKIQYDVKGCKFQGSNDCINNLNYTTVRLFLFWIATCLGKVSGSGNILYDHMHVQGMINSSYRHTNLGYMLNPTVYDIYTTSYGLTLLRNNTGSSIPYTCKCINNLVTLSYQYSYQYIGTYCRRKFPQNGKHHVNLTFAINHKIQLFTDYGKIHSMAFIYQDILKEQLFTIFRCIIQIHIQTYVKKEHKFQQIMFRIVDMIQEVHVLVMTLCIILQDIIHIVAGLPKTFSKCCLVRCEASNN